MDVFNGITNSQINAVLSGKYNKTQWEFEMKLLCIETSKHKNEEFLKLYSEGCFKDFK